MDRTETLARAGEFWSNVSRNHNGTVRRHWWEFPTIVSYINEIVLKQPRVPGLHAGFHQLMGQRLGGRRVARGLSVACGTASKEMQLLAANLVERFDLYEISQVRIDEGIARAKALGLQDRLTFHKADAFEHCRDNDYDLVYWNNALHHMLDVDFAIAWSLERLKSGGWFAMDDFVGPSRFQWSDRTLDYASRFRATLPASYLVNFDNPTTALAQEVKRPSVEGMIAMDPTEAADSGRILPCLKSRLPDAEIVLTGGCLYVVGFQHTLPHFSEVEDLAIMQAGLLVDRALIELGETLYAVALAQKA